MSEQSELQRDLGRVEGKLDSVIEMLKANSDKHSNLEKRVRSVEQKQVWFSGLAVGAAWLLTKVDFTKLLAAAHATGVGQ